MTQSQRQLWVSQSSGEDVHIPSTLERLQLVGGGCSWSHSLLPSLVPIKCTSNHPTQAFKAIGCVSPLAGGVYLAPKTLHCHIGNRCLILAPHGPPLLTAMAIQPTWLGQLLASHAAILVKRRQKSVFLWYCFFLRIYVIIKSTSQLIIFHNDYWLF